MSACPREKPHIPASPEAEEEVALLPLLASVLPSCAVLSALVSRWGRAEQSSHYLIGKKMPFSLSNRFAQSLNSFVRALLPHTLCPARTRTHTHTHTIVLGIGVYTCPLSCGKLRRKPQHLTLDGFLAVSHPCNSCSWFSYNLGDTRLHGGSGGLRWIIVGI